MRVSRNRNWGHPELVQFLERFAPLAAEATGWKRILIGEWRSRGACGTLRQCHLDECQRTPALSPPSRQAAYKRSPFRSNSRQLRCVDIKFFRSNGSSAVHFVNSANHRCGLPALSLMNRITISGPLNARRVQTSR
ncbi:MAG: penicillin-insensitive murein endopeptidase [Pseudolabrys sp.]